MTTHESDRIAHATRGCSRFGYHLLGPENRAPAALPGLAGIAACTLVSPRRPPAAFAEYLLELPQGSGADGQAALGGRGVESFAYVLDGAVALDLADEGTHDLGEGGCAYLAAGTELRLRNSGADAARCLVIRRRYVPAAGIPAAPSRISHRSEAIVREIQPGLRRIELIPVDDPRYDFTVFIMSFDPGAGLGMVEMHDEEHGLLMTAGAGVYRLGDDVHEVGIGDFIYLAPYCPQGFSADRGAGAEYLLYKDCWREAI